MLIEAVPTIINGGPVNISRTINVQLNKMIDDLKGWPAHEMWMGVVPKKLTALLEDIGISKKEVRGTASEIVRLLETSAMDIWHLTNAIKQKQPQLQHPAPTHTEKMHEGEREQMVKERQNRRQKKTKQDQYDTAAYVFTFV